MTTPYQLLTAIADLRHAGPVTDPDDDHNRALYLLACRLHGGTIDQAEAAVDALSAPHPDAGIRLPLTSPVGTFHDPSGGLSQHALELGKILTRLEESGREDTDEYARADRFLLAEPSYRWNFRSPVQAKLGAGWETELIGQRFLFNGEPHTVLAVDQTDDDWWLVHVADGRIFAAPRYTVLDEPPLITEPAVTA